MSDNWKDRPQGQRVEVSWRATAHTWAPQCRSCGVLALFADRLLKSLEDNGHNIGKLYPPSAQPPNSVWAKESECFSHPTLGFFCPKCSDDIGAKLADAIKPKDGEE